MGINQILTAEDAEDAPKSGSSRSLLKDKTLRCVRSPKNHKKYIRPKPHEGKTHSHKPRFLNLNRPNAKRSSQQTPRTAPYERRGRRGRKSMDRSQRKE